MKISVFWFRRDLRLEDNTALNHALSTGLPVMLLFIFDNNITQNLPADDARVNFIYEKLYSIEQELKKYGKNLNILKGAPDDIWENLISRYDISEVFVNRDYEPYSIDRDRRIRDLLTKKGIKYNDFKDQVIFEKSEIVKSDEKPYTVFTPYKRKWKERFDSSDFETIEYLYLQNIFSTEVPFPLLSELGFMESEIKVKEYDLSVIDDYAENRDYPWMDSTSYLGPHLRFGTVSIRQIISKLKPEHDVYLSELIWREFFMQILYHFPHVVDQNFNSKYDAIQWRNNEKDFERWCNGETGYPIVDAGMRELNNTGFMHNRVRMVAAGFLCKHLLIDWRWGEAYFAEKLLDYELSSNNGNWQWAAGTGCDAAPYFRIFNPIEQLRKFDKDLKYVKKWLPEYGSPAYPKPMVDHSFARNRALETYKKGFLK